MQNNGHAGLLEPGGGGSPPGPAPTGRPPAWPCAGRGGYSGRGLLTAAPAPAGAGPGVALKIHHEVMDKNPLLRGPGGTRHSPAGPPLPTRRGHRAAPSSQQDGGAGLFRFAAAGQRNNSGSQAAHRGHRTPMAVGTGLGSPPGLAASQDATWPGPGSCAGWARGNEWGEGPGPCQHRPPTGKRPQAAITLRGSPGQPRQERGRAGLRTGAGTEAFLPWPRRGVAGVPPWPQSACRLLRLPPGLAQRSGSGCRQHQTRGNPSSLLPASSTSNAEGRSRLRATGSNRHGTKNATEKERKQGKKKVTKGKNTNSLAEYKDLESDGATTASLERGGHGHAPPTSSTTRFGAPGAQRAGVRPSPSPGREEEVWPGARTAQCSPHPRRGFGEGG